MIVLTYLATHWWHILLVGIIVTMIPAGVVIIFCLIYHHLSGRL